jgi:orotate phosphoribosyltransferase
MTSDDVLAIFRECGALLEGHFLLTSGQHSPRYLEKFQVLQYPRHVERLCREMAERFREDAPSVVVGPTTGGVLLAYEVAKRLGARSIFAERGPQGGRVLRRGFRIEAGEPTLVVDDIMSTGGSVQDVVELVHAHGGRLVGVGVLVDRTGAPPGSGLSASFGARFEPLATVTIDCYPADACPLCAAGVPLTEPGRGKG